MAYMAHSQVPDREAVARLAFLDARYKGVQDPHLNIERCQYDLIKSALPFCTSYLFKDNLRQLAGLIWPM